MNRTLILWRLRPLLPWSIGLGTASLMWALGVEEPLFRLTGIPSLAIAAHALLIAGLLGKTKSPEFGFLYARGFDRETLWRAMLLAGLAAALIAWLPPALAVWTGARSAYQDYVLASPDYPLMNARETLTPLAWLAGYGMLLPVWIYSWIRGAHPASGRGAGVLLAAAWLWPFFLYAQSRFFLAPEHDWLAWFAALVAAAVPLAALAAGRILHRSLEAAS